MRDFRKLEQVRYEGFFSESLEEYKLQDVYKQNITDQTRQSLYVGLQDHRSADYTGPTSQQDGGYLTSNDVFLNIFDFSSAQKAINFVKEREEDGKSQIFNYKNQAVMQIHNSFNQGYSTSVDVYILDRIGSRVLEVQLAKAGKGIRFSTQNEINLAKALYRKVIDHALKELN